MLILAGCSSSGGSSQPTTLKGYGKTVDDVAKILGCSLVEPRDSDSIAECLGEDGNSVLISTFESADVQGLTLAMLRDDGSLGCALVLPGVVLSGDNDEITVVLGESAAVYTTVHGGHVTGAC